MTKQEYNKYIQSFNERGYKFVEGQCSNEGYYYKVIESRKDIGSDSGVDCLLVFNFYDLADSCDGGGASINRTFGYGYEQHRRAIGFNNFTPQVQH